MPQLHVLHLSHTDIRSDSRILKEMNALAEQRDKYLLYGIGIERNENLSAAAQTDMLQIVSIRLRSKILRFIPTFVRHVLTFIEFAIRVFVIANRIKPDIIHGHDNLVLPICVILKSITGAKVIYDAHELESNKNGLTSLWSKVTLLTERVLWRFVDYLIVVSPSIQKWYQNNIGSKPSEVILNTPILNIAEEGSGDYAKDYLRRKYNISANDKIFIYVGILGKGRGIESLVDIFSHILGAHLIFIGYGELTDFIVKHSNFFMNIHLHPAVKHEEVVALIRSADVGICMIENVSLSDYYCLPNKLFEYCFAGVPVIASAFPDIENIVNKYSLGICSGQDKESINNAIDIYILNKINKRIDIGKLKEIDWAAQKTKLFNIYEKLSILKND